MNVTRITTPDSPALTALCERLAAAAPALEEPNAWPGPQLLDCARSGVFEWFIAESLGGRPATADDDADAGAVTEGARAAMGRHVDADGLPNLLATNLDHPRWEEVAERCLTCGNCTMACPTCFCTSVDDVNLLEGDIAERHRHWDSCFSVEYSHIHGGATRPTGRSRYRQWLTHKFGTWVEQFGTSGCVGCGRCVTWCPVGIDVTEELTAIRLTDGEVSDAHA